MIYQYQQAKYAVLHPKVIWRNQICSYLQPGILGALVPNRNYIKSNAASPKSR